MYPFLKLWLQLALKFYCRNVVIDNKNLNENIPTILASNHPNSFFDALIITAHSKKEIHFLARGDAFKKPWAAKILIRLNIIPIFRLEEGKENLANNEQSFNACINVLKKGGTVLIFPEGLSRHEWQLRPLRKGAARLAYLGWEKYQIQNLIVQPIGLDYHSFNSVPKEIMLHYGNTINKGDFNLNNEGLFYNQFNQILKNNIDSIIIHKTDDIDIKNLLPSSKNEFLKVLLIIPAFIGWLTQRWYYSAWKKFALKKTLGTVFYDSVLFACLMLTYPIFVILISSLFSIITGNPAFLLLIFLLPFTAWCYKEYKIMLK